MRTFLVALLIFLSITAFVVVNAVYIGGTAKELLALAEKLPADAESFERSGEEAKETMDALYALWDSRFRRLTRTTGYDSLDRADEAILEMRVHFENGNGEDFSVAEQTFLDAVRRLRELESFSLNGIL